LCVRIYMHIYTYIHAHTCMHTYIHTYIQESIVDGSVSVRVSFCEVAHEQIRDVLRRDFYSPGGLKVCEYICIYMYTYVCCVFL
jgi:hypothetical protein